MGDDVILAVIESILHFFKVDFPFELANEVWLRFQQFNCRSFVPDFTSYDFELVKDAGKLSLLLRLGIVD